MMKVLDAATPISGPARVWNTMWASRAKDDPTTLVTAATLAPCPRANRTAPRVSAVSPDWLIPITSERASSTGSR